MAKRINMSAVGPMPWRDFVLGFEIASRALENDAAVNRADTALDNAGTGQTRALKERIRKDPFLRVLDCVQRYFGRSYQHTSSFTYRFWALLHLMRRGHIAHWMHESAESDRQQYHPAVLLAAAEVKLTRNAHFPADRFNARVEQIIEQEGQPAPDTPPG